MAVEQEPFHYSECDTRNPEADPLILEKEAVAAFAIDVVRTGSFLFVYLNHFADDGKPQFKYVSTENGSYNFFIRQSATIPEELVFQINKSRKAIMMICPQSAQAQEELPYSDKRFFVDGVSRKFTVNFFTTNLDELKELDEYFLGFMALSWQLLELTSS